MGKLLIVTGCSMGLPLICSIYYKENDLVPILISALIIILIGLPLWWIFRKNNDLDIKDGFFLAVFGWILVSAVSALPFMIHGSIPSFTDAFFDPVVTGKATEEDLGVHALDRLDLGGEMRIGLEQVDCQHAFTR